MTLLGDNRATFRGLETFPAPGVGLSIRMISDEVTALCPVTGQPDWYEVQIAYRPLALCLESKSLKLYLGSLRGLGVFCETLAASIAREVWSVASPAEVTVVVKQKPRGGVSIIASATIPSPGT